VGRNLAAARSIGSGLTRHLTTAHTQTTPGQPDQARQLRERAAAGERKSALATEFGISRETVYSYLRSETVAG
jgi:DNA invertase Pin-like site-specific DNA recombinase